MNTEVTHFCRRVYRAPVSSSYLKSETSRRQEGILIKHSVDTLTKSASNYILIEKTFIWLMGTMLLVPGREVGTVTDN